MQHQQKFILRLRRGRRVRTHPTSFFRPLRPGRPDGILKRRLPPDATADLNDVPGVLTPFSNADCALTDLNDIPRRPHTSCSSPAPHLTS
jgi:hypothetical protein